MPKLLLLAPAERVIIDQFENTASLIGVFGGLMVPIPGSDTIPNDAALPFRWSVFTMWETAEGERGTTFQQRTRLISPSGHLLIDGVLDFKVAAELHRNRYAIEGFPIAEMGRHELQVSLRMQGADEWTTVGTFPINVGRIDPVLPTTSAV
jgi:hypothetical protein